MAKETRTDQQVVSVPRRRKNEPARDRGKVDDRTASTTMPPGAGLPEFGGSAPPPPGMESEWQPTTDDIGRRAYEIYEGRGREHGRDLDDWLEAEQELTKRGQRKTR